MFMPKDLLKTIEKNIQATARRLPSHLVLRTGDPEIPDCHILFLPDSDRAREWVAWLDEHCGPCEQKRGSMVDPLTN